MTINTTSLTKSYTGNAVTTEFSFPYRFLENSDLVVTIIESDDTEVPQVLDTDYTVSGAGDDAGGTVTMITAPAIGERLFIRRTVPLTQGIDYISGDAFPAETHEEGLDRLTMIAQQLSEGVDRSLRLSDTDASGSDVELPSLESDKYLRVNSAGDGLVFSDGVTSTAEDIVFTPAGSISSITVQLAIEELDSDKEPADATILKEADIGVTVQSFTTAVQKDSGTGAASLPTGTTAQRPGTPSEGMFRRNSETSSFEGYDGSSWTGVGGASGGAGNPFVYENDTTVTEDYTITPGKNAMSAGPLTIDTGVTVTVPSGSVWSIV